MRKGFSLVAFARGAAGVAVLLAVWEVFARSGMFSPAMTPPLESVGRVIWAMLADGTFFKNALATLARVFIGLGISFAIAVPLGVIAALRPGGTFVMTAPFIGELEDPDHPQHFPSPVAIGPFLESLGMSGLAPGVWKKS